MFGFLEKITNIGIKKCCLYFHYLLGGIATLVMLTFLIIGTVSTKVFDIFWLFSCYKIILAYCLAIVLIITAVSVYEDIRDDKPDWFAIFINCCMIATFGLMATCCVYMFTHQIEAESRQMFQYMIGVFAGMFGGEGIMGTINNITKRKYKVFDKVKADAENVAENIAEVVSEQMHESPPG